MLKLKSNIQGIENQKLTFPSFRFYQLHQYLQYHVIGDSKPVACLLLSLESVYAPARQLALDMMTRLGTATEEMIEIFLAEGKLISALQLGSIILLMQNSIIKKTQRL